MIKKLISGSLKALHSLATGKVDLTFDGIPLEFENVPIRKILNWAFLEASVVFKPSKPWGQPTHLQIEPSSICNLRCPACRVVTGLGRPGGLMSLELFNKIVDEAYGSLFLISLWGWGEPFLNPHVYDMITLAKARGIAVISSTNGHFLAKPGQIERLAASGLDALIVAVDGATQDTYALYRRPGKLRTVLEGVRKLTKYKRLHNLQTPLVNVRLVVMRQNEHEIPQMIELAKSCGADMLSLKTMNPLASDPYSLDPTPENDSADGFIPGNPRYQRFSYTADGKQRVRLKENPCKRLWNNPKIHHDGAVCMCTCDVAGRFPMGNLCQNTLKQVWISRQYQQKRKGFRTDWERVQPCCTCTYAYAGGNCIDEIISDTFFFDVEKTTQ